MDSPNEATTGNNMSDDELYPTNARELLQDLQNAPATRGAPIYTIPSRDLSAVEVPAVVNDVDRAMRAFGRAPSLENVRHVR